MFLKKSSSVKVIDRTKPGYDFADVQDDKGPERHQVSRDRVPGTDKQARGDGITRDVNAPLKRRIVNQASTRASQGNTSPTKVGK